MKKILLDFWITWTLFVRVPVLKTNRLISSWRLYISLHCLMTWFSIRRWKQRILNTMARTTLNLLSKERNIKVRLRVEVTFVSSEIFKLTQEGHWKKFPSFIEKGQWPRLVHFKWIYSNDQLWPSLTRKFARRSFLKVVLLGQTDSVCIVLTEDFFHRCDSPLLRTWYDLILNLTEWSFVV